MNGIMTSMELKRVMAQGVSHFMYPETHRNMGCVVCMEANVFARRGFEKLARLENQFLGRKEEAHSAAVVVAALDAPRERE